MHWKGEMFFSHGSNHSRGVLVLLKDNLDFKIHSTKVDSQSRYIFLDAYIQDSPYCLLNIYAPANCRELFLFCKDVSDILKGDFRVIYSFGRSAKHCNTLRIPIYFHKRFSSPLLKREFH